MAPTGRLHPAVTKPDFTHYQSVAQQQDICVDLKAPREHG